MLLKELREKRALVAVALRSHIEKEFHARNKVWTTEGRAEFERLNKEIDGLDEQIRTAEAKDKEERAVAEIYARTAEAESTPNNPVSSEQVRTTTLRGQECQDLAIRTWCRMGRDRLRNEISQREKDNFGQYRAAMYAWGDHGAAIGDCGPDEITVRIDSGYGLGREVSGRSMALTTAQFRARWAAEMRAAMGVSVDSMGGYAVPEGFTYSLEEALRAYGGIREHATITRTETANPLPMPTIVDATPGSVDAVYGGANMNVGELLGENNATDLQGLSPVMGALILGAQKFSSRMIPVSFQLLRDSAFPLASYLGKMMGTRIGRTMARYWAHGSGRGVTPRGICLDAPVAVATGTTNQILYTDIINLEHAVEPSYRDDGFCWLLHDMMVKQLRLMLDGLGRPMWVDQYADVKEGAPRRFAGYYVQRVQEMAYDFTGDCIDGTTNPQIMIGGHIPSYQIREVQSIRILRLKERAAERDQELFLAFMEADGGLLNAGTFPVKAMANHGGTLGRVRFAPPAKNRGNLAGRPSDLDEGALVDDDLNEIDPSNPPPRKITPEAKAAALQAIKKSQEK